MCWDGPVSRSEREMRESVAQLQKLADSAAATATDSPTESSSSSAASADEIAALRAVVAAQFALLETHVSGSFSPARSATRRFSDAFVPENERALFETARANFELERKSVTDALISLEGERKVVERERKQLEAERRAVERERRQLETERPQPESAKKRALTPKTFLSNLSNFMSPAAAQKGARTPGSQSNSVSKRARRNVYRGTGVENA
jgi:hypothetical protein